MLVPRLHRRRKWDQLDHIAARLLESVVQVREQTDVIMRDERVLLAVWIRSLAAKGRESDAREAENEERERKGLAPLPDPVEPPRERANPRQVASEHDLPMDDKVMNEACTKWLLTPGANAHEDAYQVAIGRVVAHAAFVTTESFARSVADVPFGHGTDVADQLAQLLTKVAITCTFDRIRDKYMHQLLRSTPRPTPRSTSRPTPHVSRTPPHVPHPARCKLTAARQAYLPWEPSTPFEQLPKQYHGMSVNELIRPYIETTCGAVCTTVDWATISTTDVYVMVVSMLQESLDNVVTPLLSNSEVCTYVNDPCPVPYVFTGNYAIRGPEFGYVWNNTLYTVAPKTPYPVPSTILCWMDACMTVLPKTHPMHKSLTALYNAVVHPDSILPSNQFYKFLYGEKESKQPAAKPAAGKKPAAGPAQSERRR